MQIDALKIEVLADGTIKTTSDAVSAANHDNAEQFLLAMARLAGGETTREARTERKPHTRIPIMIPISVIQGSPTRIPPTRNGTDSSSAMFSFEQAPAVAPHLVHWRTLRKHWSFCISAKGYPPAFPHLC